MVKLKNKLIGLDTNIFIYFYEQNQEFGSLAKRVFEKLSAKQAQAVTSIITLTELLSLPASEREVEVLKANFLETPNLTICDFNQTIAIEAGRIRRIYSFRVPDSIQLATSLYQKVDLFLTNDNKLKAFKEIPIVMLGES